MPDQDLGRKGRWEAPNPLLLVFPGACAVSLRRLGAAAERLKELEIIVKDPDGLQEFKRRATTLALTEHQYVLGGNIKEYNTALEPSVELCAELDERWTSDAVVASMEKNPKETMLKAVAKIGQITLDEGTFYGHRMMGEKPNRTWAAKLRQPAASAEKIICGSGQDGFFLKPSANTTLEAADKFAIVWGG